MGASRPWMEAMEKMTGQKKMSTKALREYFQPIEMWLKKENKKSNKKLAEKVALMVKTMVQKPVCLVGYSFLFYFAS